MTGEKGGLLAGLRAEALKSHHAAPVRLAVLMALPMPLLGAMPYRGVQIFSAWNYWYALFLPVSLSLVVAHYGLGLHAASEAASAHGGSVSLANSPSGGAVATIAVPLCGA